MRGIFCLVFSLSVTVVLGQFSFHMGTGTESISLGRTSVTLTGPSSIFGNQGALIESSTFSLSANASRRYNINGLDLFSVGLIWPHSSGTFGFSILQYGLEGYKEQKLGLAYARKISKGTGIGVQFNYLNLSQLEFGNHGYFSLEVGLYSRLTDKIYLGAHIFAPGESRIEGDNGVPVRMRIGPSITFAENTIAYIEVEKTIDLDPILKFGMAYRMNEVFQVRLGFIPEPSEFSFGFGYAFGGSFKIDGGFMYDQRLGTTPSAGFHYIAPSQTTDEP